MKSPSRKCMSIISALLITGGLLQPEAAATTTDSSLREELGLEHGTAANNPVVKRSGTLSRTSDVLLIPESTNDTVGMYDPQDGTFLGVLITGAGELSTPINAILGPDGNIYVSDQGKDGVMVYDINGTFLHVYCDATDGLDNVRGICFRGDHLFVCTYHGEVAEFDGIHSRVGDFILDTTNVSMWDVLFLPGGDCLVNNSSADTCAHYDASGIFIADILSPVDFPEQVNFDLTTPGEFLINVFSDQVVHDFDLTGTIHQTSPHGVSGRGVFRLGNGNLLITSSVGVQEIDPVTGVLIETKSLGSARFIESIGGSSDPGVSYCPGDGTGTGCPCANNNNGAMGGCDWGDASFPEGGVLSATGSASMGMNDTFLVATGIEDDFGIFFGADNQVNGGNGNPLNDGLRCAGGGLIRLIPPTIATGNQMTLPAPLQTLDTGAAGGATRRYQYWFRTPSGPCGQTANLTNGYEIVWVP